MTKLSSSILQEIKSEHLRPIPRWRFLLRSGVLWAAIACGIIFAGIFFGSLISGIGMTDWQLASRWPGRQFGLFRDAVGWFGAIGLIVMTAASVLLFRSTKRGYRYGFIALVAAILMLGIGLGLPLVKTPLPERFYVWHDQLFPPRFNAAVFHNPDAGRLLGRIVSVEGDTAYLQAVDGSSWALWLFDNQVLSKYDLVEVFGERIDESTFAVISLRPVPPNYSVQEIPADSRIQE